jgi:hypothetical protein
MSTLIDWTYAGQLEEFAIEINSYGRLISHARTSSNSSQANSGHPDFLAVEKTCAIVYNFRHSFHKKNMKNGSLGCYKTACNQSNQ